MARRVHLKWILVASAIVLLVAGCSSECGPGASCPATADVAGVRYAVSGAVDLVQIEDKHTRFAAISATNSGAIFADTTAYAIMGIDPRVLLVASSRVSADSPGRYRELWSLADDPFPVLFCGYMTNLRRSAQPECQQP